MDAAILLKAMGVEVRAASRQLAARNMPSSAYNKTHLVFFADFC
jgi:hypothetical protein